MKGYVMMLIGTVLICSVALMIIPEGKIGKYVRLAGALCVLCVSISPLSSFIEALSGIDGNSLPDIIFGEGVLGDGEGELSPSDVYEENLMSASSENISLALRSMICREIKVDAENIEVYVELIEGEEEYLPQKVSVVLYGSAVLTDPHLIEEYIDTLLGCECEIIYG